MFFMFTVVECMFTIGERMFPVAEHIFSGGEHKLYRDKNTMISSSEKLSLPVIWKLLSMCGKCQ